MASMFSLSVLLWLLAVGNLIVQGEESAVLVFTGSDFEAQVSAHRVILVFFYAPWCGYCKKLHPEYEKAASILRQFNPPILLAKINCDTHKKMCNQYGVTTYPKLKLFRNGLLMQDYSGTRTSEGLVRLMTLKSGPSFTVLDTAADLAGFRKSNDQSIVGFFESNTTSMALHFKDLSDYLVEKHRFAITLNPQLRQMYGLEESIVLFRPGRLETSYEPSYVRTATDANLDGLLSWTADVMHGFCGHRVPSNTDEFLKRPLVVAYYDVNFETDREFNLTLRRRNRILEANALLRNDGINIHFAFSNAKDFRKELETFGLEPPTNGKFALAARDKHQSKFTALDVETLPELVDFVKAFLGGRIPQYVMSEPESYDTEYDKVKVVVGSTFENVVLDPTKDVLIEIYAPWCGNCRRLAPIYWQLGELLDNEPDLVIAKMNGITNDSPNVHYRTTKYPTIFFAPKGSKDSPKIYQGPRALDSLLQFVAAESSSELEGFTRSGRPKMPQRDL